MLTAVKEARRLFDKKSDFTVEKNADGTSITNIDIAVRAAAKNICWNYLGNNIHLMAEGGGKKGTVLKNAPDGMLTQVYRT